LIWADDKANWDWLVHSRNPMILSRLKNAIREQNWFAVLLEFLIVVSAVVMGFQLTTWGENRGNRQKEELYLIRLVDDLLETERIMTETDSSEVPSDSSLALVMRAFRARDRPHSDTLLQWLWRSTWVEEPRPVLGTAESLVLTGELSLVTNDNLRSAISNYLDLNRTVVVLQRTMGEQFDLGFRELVGHVDFLEVTERGLQQTQIDSMATSNFRFAIPAGPRQSPFPFSAERFLSDREAYTTLTLLRVASIEMEHYRHQMRESAERLRAKVEAELGR